MKKEEMKLSTDVWIPSTRHVHGTGHQSHLFTHHSNSSPAASSSSPRSGKRSSGLTPPQKYKSFIETVEEKGLLAQAIKQMKM
jgi:hypothetical protein